MSTDTDRGDDDDAGLVIDETDVEGGLRVRVDGELTMATRDQLADCLMAAIDARHHVVEIDMGAVSFMDSQGLWALMRARQYAENEDTLKIVDVSVPVRRLLQMTALDALFGYPPPD
jgi:anti-anti-sigma factor